MGTFEALYRSAVQDVLLGQGIYFEHLAAIAYKVAEQQQTILHDVKLLGSVSGVPHQIDLVVKSRDGSTIEHIVECKDHSTSQSNVGLPEVRSFFAVAHDIRPATATIVSATGFTGQARQFARTMPYAPGRYIRLGILGLNSDMIQRCGWHHREIAQDSVLVPIRNSFLSPASEVERTWVFPVASHPDLEGLDSDLITVQLNGLAADAAGDRYLTDRLEWSNRATRVLMRLEKTAAEYVIRLKAENWAYRNQTFNLSFAGKYRMLEEVRASLMFRFLLNGEIVHVTEQEVTDIGRVLFAGNE